MKITRQIDVIVNVFLPVLLGSFRVYLGDPGRAPVLIRNHLPDGLWSYSFMAALLITWNRQVNYLWITIACLLSAGFELLQYFHWIAGTGDIIDLVVYLLFIGIALWVNHYSRRIYTVKSVNF